MNTGPSSIANYGLTFVFDIRHPNWYIATKIWVLRINISRFQGTGSYTRIETEALLALNYREPGD
jgi:hypothetical protein